MSRTGPESLLLAAASDILLLVDPATLLICAASPSACTQLGYPQEALLGRPITDIECALSDVFFWDEVRNGGGADLQDAEGLYQCADGSLLNTTKSVFRMGDEPPWIVIRARSIADEKRVEEELALMASQLRATLEATADGILVRNRQGRISNMNRRFSQMWQIPDELLLRHEDQRLFEFMMRQLADPAWYAQHLERLGTDEEGESFDTLALRDGRAFECKSRPARHGEQIIGRVYCFTDVTQRQRAEQDLIAARDAATSASRAKGDFLAMMSHEIRTPMNGIIGMAQLLETTSLTQEQHDYVSTMRSSGDALLAIINDILDYSKIEARKMELEQTSFSLRAMLADIERLFAQQALAKQVGFRCQAEADVRDGLIGDPVRLRQILINLVGNAFKFTDKGGIDVAVREAAQQPGRVCLHFSVRDTGIGIPPDKQARIFTPFEQADMSTTRRFGGTGLGLSICRMLCELMGGEIGVNSEPGAGAEFWFEVCLAPGVAAQTNGAGSEADEVQVPEQAAILVVEDNSVNILVLTNLLRKLGARDVVTARHGEEALEACKAWRFDLVFMDTHMPVMDGLSATRALRSEGYAMRIIGVSADAMSGDRQAALDSGMDDYITKPVSLKVLRQSIEAWLLTR